MKFGLVATNAIPFASGSKSVLLAQAAERAGFESLWTVEHVIVPDDYTSAYPYDPTGKMALGSAAPLPDPLIWLTWVAAATERIRLATGILILPEHNPVILAKAVASLDDLSGGRVELGVGTGWLREEFDALGVPWERRGARTEDYISAIRALWDADSASYAGEFVTFKGVSSNPKPVRGRVPIVIGGHTRTAAERAGRLGDGFFPGKGDIAELVDIAQQTATTNGRDPAAIEVTTIAAEIAIPGAEGAERVEQLRAQGVHRILIPAFLFSRDTENRLAELGDHLIGATP